MTLTAVVFAIGPRRLTVAPSPGIQVLPGCGSGTPERPGLRVIQQEIKISLDFYSTGTAYNFRASFRFPDVWASEYSLFALIPFDLEIPTGLFGITTIYGTEWILWVDC